MELEQFVSLNAQFPGKWSINVERLVTTENTVISVAKVTPEDDLDTNFVISFFEFQDRKIIKLDEYWGVYGSPEEWREGTQLGNAFR